MPGFLRGLVPWKASLLRFLTARQAAVSGILLTTFPFPSILADEPGSRLPNHLAFSAMSRESGTLEDRETRVCVSVSFSFCMHAWCVCVCFCVCLCVCFSVCLCV